MILVWIRPARLERLADRADAAVHHVARRDDVDAGLGLHQRLLRQHRHGLVVEDVAGRVEQAVLAVRGERVERDVGHQAELGEAAS